MLCNPQWPFIGKTSPIQSTDQLLTACLPPVRNFQQTSIGKTSKAAGVEGLKSYAQYPGLVKAFLSLCIDVDERPGYCDALYRLLLPHNHHMTEPV